VVDQALKVQTPVVDFKELGDLRSTYEVVTGRPPPEGRLPSAEQLSGLKALLDMGRVPYVDFAVWTPFGAHMAKFQRTEAAVFVNNELVTKTIEGPRTYESWAQSWLLYEVAMISLGAASPGTLASYHDGIKVLLRIFPAKWGILLATDVVVRTERWTRLREQLERDRPAYYDPARPWDSVIALSAYGAEGPNAQWWQTHFVLPAATANTAAGMEKTVGVVEQAPSRSPRASSSGPPAKRPRAGPAPAAPDDICTNWNLKQGSCAGQGPCSHGRRHVCRICKDNHRSCDVHGDGPGASKATEKPKGGKPKGKHQRYPRSGAGR